VDLHVGGDHIQVLGEGRLLAREALLHLGAELGHLLEDELDVGIHGTELGLLATRVVDRVQRGTRSRPLIPLVNLSELESAEIGGRRREAGRIEERRSGEEQL
jgi:hypothetical protein